MVSSVSCIYGLGAPEEFFDMMISLRPGMEKDRDEVIKELIDIQYNRNEMDFHRGTFRVRGDVLKSSRPTILTGQFVWNSLEMRLIELQK